jgi:hypothetical protein
MACCRPLLLARPSRAIPRRTARLFSGEHLDAAISDASRRPNVRIGIIPWTTPVTQFPRGGFHLFDDDAAIVATDVATATMTAPADVATYAEIFTSLERTASFGDEAREHLARIAADYQRLALD